MVTNYSIIHASIDVEVEQHYSCRNSFRANKVDVGSKTSYEFSEFVIKSSSAYNFRLVIFYRPPYSSEHNFYLSVFFTEFFNHIELLLLCKAPLFICEDFNIHLIAKKMVSQNLFMTYLSLLVFVNMSSKQRI